MEKNNLYIQVVLGIIAVILTAGILYSLSSLQLWMPETIPTMVVLGIIILIGVTVSFILKERGGDEREINHSLFSGKVAFLSGTSVLLVGIIKEITTRNVDFWLVTAFITMVLAKVLALIYSHYRN